MLNPNRQYLFLSWSPYLAQWYAHEQYRIKHADSSTLTQYIYQTDKPAYELEPVETLRGSVERDIIEQNLSKHPEGVPVRPSDGTTICILIPFFQYRDPRVYNYMSPSALKVLESYIRGRLRKDLYTYMMKTYDSTNSCMRVDDCILAFMEKNGIENDINGDSLNNLKMLYYRAKETYRVREYQKRKKL